MAVHQKDYPIILSLIENPLATDIEVRNNIYEKLGKKIAITTVLRRIQRLRKNGVILGASAEINYPRIGLQLCSFIIVPNGDNWKVNIDIIEQMGSAHPYTVYKNRVYGAKNGVFIQFAIPIGSLPLLLELFENLKDRNIIETYDQYIHEYSGVPYFTQLSKWDLETNSWKVDFNDLNDIFETTPDKFILEHEKVESIHKELKMLDIVLIREMTRDARRSQMDISRQLQDPTSTIGQEYSGLTEELNRSKQTYSKRIRDLKSKNVFSHFRLLYDRKQFGMFNQALYVANISNKLTQLEEAIKSEKLPFPSSMQFTRDKFLYWINIGPIDLMELTDILTHNFTKLKFYLFGRNSSRYYLWHVNYSVENHSWRSSREWMIDNTLNKLFAL